VRQLSMNQMVLQSARTIDTNIQLTITHNSQIQKAKSGIYNSKIDLN
jgi:hypothetical protein